ncbi:SMI1/KNR4 family protein [Flavobacterium sp.]|uniref:SMI1/KNR4 family protein n=1 Tax=Flavobacterium sp. TaxID=239 RepID=UPI00286CF2C8|nr:SMI1/KNR4 family protein [Flavobacterium sp.]
MITDIWKQPAEGFNDASIGRSEKQILEKELAVGFKFPTLYREHLKMQNGGYLWKTALHHNDNVSELLYNGSTFDPVINDSGYNTLKDVLLEYSDVDELKKSSKLEFLYLERLPILSHMDGHTMLCFDYGYNVEFEYQEPQICYFELECAENGFEEKLRINSYEELINNLVYYGYESTSFYIGLKSEKNIEEIAEQFIKIYNKKLELKKDDGYGWYNFKNWYSGKLEINSNLALYLKLTPNEFLSKNHLLQNHKQFNYIIDIDLRMQSNSITDNSNHIISLINEKMNAFLNSFGWDFLLIPFHKENLEELENIKKTFENRLY